METTHPPASNPQHAQPSPGDAWALALLQHGSSAVCGYDASDRITFWNARYLQFFPEVQGIVREGLPFVDTVRPFLSLQHPRATAGETEAAVASAVQRHRLEQGPIQYQRADGRWLELRMFPQADGGRVKIWSDVTAERAPGTDGSALADLMTVVNVGLTLHDGAGQLVYVNSRFFSENFLRVITGVPEIQTRQRRGDYWRKFHEVFDETPAYRQLIDDEAAGPLPQPVTLCARTGRFYRIEEQAWQGGIASVWTDVSELVGRENALRTAHSELEVLNARLVDLAETDALTGLPNRRRFQAALAEAQGRVGDGVPDTVGVIDLDFFKAVNDRFGHDAGDAVLVEAAARMARTLRPGDLLARLGGEEFGVLFRSVSLEQGSEAAEGLRKTLSARPFAAGVAEVDLTASIGLARLTGARSPEDSLRQADIALFKAKDGGRDMIFWDHPAPAAGPAGSAPADAATRAASVAADLLEDEGLDAEQLQQKYQAHGDQHPRFDRAAWRRARAEGRTLDHYWNWVDYSVALAFA